jgi:DNA-binding transcriptional ArsR family regulator
MSLGVASTGYLRALAHPLRLRMLSLLTGSVMSAAELARELDVAHGSASYHLRQLEQAGLVEVAEERSHRGGQERRYRVRPTARIPAAAAPDDRALLAEVLGAELRRRATYADPDAPGTTADAELWVDPAVWADLCDRVRAAMTDLHAAARPLREPGSRRVGATVALFGMTP